MSDKIVTSNLSPNVRSGQIELRQKKLAWFFNLELL